MSVVWVLEGAGDNLRRRRTRTSTGVLVVADRRIQMSSKNKKRALLPARPETLSVDQILEDMDSANHQDPVFSILQPPHPGAQGSEVTYRQGRRYLDVNQRLQEVRGHLGLQREGLHSAGEQLQRTVTEVKGRAL